MIPVTSLFPQPIEIEVTGRTLLIGEVRPVDLSRLQAYIEKRSERPLEALLAREDQTSNEERRAALWAVYDVLEGDPPAWGNEAGERIIYQDDEGILFLLGVILRQCDPSMSDDELRDIAFSLSKADFGAILRAWRRANPLDVVEHLLGIDDREPAPSVSLVEAICEVVEATGWTLEQVSTMSMTQIRTIRSGGKERERGVKVEQPKGGNLKRAVAEMKAKRRQDELDREEG
jgi:hypothetical protein